MRPTDLAPKILLDELLRLAKLDKNWVTWEIIEGKPNEYICNCNQKTWLKQTWQTGADGFAMLAMSRWLLDGPKIFKPSKEQCKALEQIDVNLLLEEYTQPYPAILVELDYPPFNSVLCYKEEKSLACVLHSKDHLHDITTTVRRSDCMVEESLRKFDESCRVDAPTATMALRVACNSCLALSHYGCHLDYLFPEEVKTDRRLARENTERGERARGRLSLAVQTTSFDHEVRLYRTRSVRPDSMPTGREVSSHWRRGHWAMQPYGPQASLRKRILRPPVFVRADLFVGDPADTMTTYK